MSSHVFQQNSVENNKYIFITKVSVNENDEKDIFLKINLVYNKEEGTLSEYRIKQRSFHRNYSL